MACNILEAFNGTNMLTGVTDFDPVSSHLTFYAKIPVSKVKEISTTYFCLYLVEKVNHRNISIPDEMCCIYLLHNR